MWNFLTWLIFYFVFPAIVLLMLMFIFSYDFRKNNKKEEEKVNTIIRIVSSVVCWLLICSFWATWCNIIEHNTQVKNILKVCEVSKHQAERMVNELDKDFQFEVIEKCKQAKTKKKNMDKLLNIISDVE